MKDKTNEAYEQRVAEANAYVDNTLDKAPPTLTNANIAQLAAFFISAYATDAEHARKLLELTLKDVNAALFGDPETGECMCPRCVEQRATRTN